MGRLNNKSSIINSNSIYNQNMAVLKEHYPKIYSLLKNIDRESPYKIVVAANGMPNIWIKEKQKYYYDHLDPVADAKKQIDSLRLKNARLALFLGMGLGYEFNYFLQEIASKQCTEYILVLEPDPYLFQQLLMVADLSGVLRQERITFLVGINLDELYVHIRSYLHNHNRFRFLKALKPVYHYSSYALHKEYYLNALRIFREAAAHEMLNYGNSPEDSLIGLENILANIEEIVGNPGINLLFNKFKGRPAVVVATGPSLNNNKHLLKGLENKALIISVDASLKILLDMGVKPHVVTSLERMMPTVKLLEGFSRKEVENVYLAACPVVRPEMYQVYPGPRIIVYRNFDHFRWLGINRGIVDIKLSAGNMAFKVAEALGCDPIILIGQDLAYGPNGHTHASGAVYGEKQCTPDNDIVQVMGNDGQPIMTNRTWYSFLKAYEIDVAAYKGKCINSTEGGAYIMGTHVMPFSEAIASYIREEFYPLEIIKSNLAQFTEDDAREDLERLLERIDVTVEELECINCECKKGLEIINRHRQELQDIMERGGQADGYLRQHIGELEEEILGPKKKCIDQYDHTFQMFLAHIIQSYAIKFEMEMIAVPEKYDDYDIARSEIMLNHNRWYSVVGEIANICIELLKKAKERLLQTSLITCPNTGREIKCSMKKLF